MQKEPSFVARIDRPLRFLMANFAPILHSRPVICDTYRMTRRSRVSAHVRGSGCRITNETLPNDFRPATILFLRMFCVISCGRKFQSLGRDVFVSFYCRLTACSCRTKSISSRKSTSEPCIRRALWPMRSAENVQNDKSLWTGGSTRK